MKMQKYNVMEIPDAECGNWKIETFEITESGANLFNLRCMFRPGMGHRIVKSGMFKRLLWFNNTIMSNTPAELFDHSHFIYKAKGRILINGLGLGVVLAEVLNKEEVEEVTVIELSQTVIHLVKPYFQKDSRLEIILADALEWQPPKGKRYNAVWHDIWDNINPDNLPQMHKLHRRYGKRTDWQGSWSRELCEMYK